MDRFVFAPPMVGSGSGFGSRPKKSHSEAESRRRRRINDHLTTLRRILPSKVKTDKATLLMEAVQHVKGLQQKLAGGEGLGVKPPLPTEKDSVSVSRSENEDDGNNNNNNNIVVKATVCCEDRPGLNRDLVRVIRSVRGNMTRTEMGSVGGRTLLVMTLKLGLGGGGCGPDAGIRRLRRGLAAVAENRVSGETRMKDYIEF